MLKLIHLSALLMFASSLHAESLADSDSDLPQPFDEAFADELLAHSPFTRIVNLEETLQLTGIAFVDGHPVATFLNRVTQERLTVSEVPNAQGWKITEAIPGVGLHDTEVRVMIGSEVITMHYGDAQLTPGAGKKGVPGVYVERSPGSRSGSKGDDHIKTSSFLGANGKELYGSLSREGRDKLKEAVHAYVAKHPEQTQEQNAAYAQKIYPKIKAADQKSATAGSLKSTKPTKPGKNK